MREALLVEHLPEGGVRILSRSDDPELIQHLAAELADRDRRRLARLEGPRLVHSRGPEPETNP